MSITTSTESRSVLPIAIIFKLICFISRTMKGRTSMRYDDTFTAYVKDDENNGYT